MYIMVTFCPFKEVFYFYLWRHYNYGFQCLYVAIYQLENILHLK